MEIWLIIASLLERSVLFILLILSMWSVAIMIDRRRVFKAEAAPDEIEEIKKRIQTGSPQAILDWIGTRQGLRAGVLRSALSLKIHGMKSTNHDSNVTSPSAERVDRAVRSYLTEQRSRLERGLSVLATLGANAPFIGLFGTVLGIIRAFAALGESQGGATSVMSGISQALYATAAGLFVAIPAVIAYNYFSTRLREMLAESDALKDFYLAQMGQIELQSSSGRPDQGGGR